MEIEIELHIFSQVGKCVLAFIEGQAKENARPPEHALNMEVQQMPPNSKKDKNRDLNS